ncbi:hypothetical protein [Caballeronia sp. Sq4a]|uniref:hypothetical protein n=1 Tax=Caballeronia sp. Sq4a TaxID=2878152 RepID=UPI0020BEB125|nr:hypothetical protein [Caballeronia sp. Sq4a]
MKTPRCGDDLRHFDTSSLLSPAERLAARNTGRLQKLPRRPLKVVIGKYWVPGNVARQFAYLNVGSR